MDDLMLLIIFYFVSFVIGCLITFFVMRNKKNSDTLSSFDEEYLDKLKETQNEEIKTLTNKYESLLKDSKQKNDDLNLQLENSKKNGGGNLEDLKLNYEKRLNEAQCKCDDLNEKLQNLKKCNEENEKGLKLQYEDLLKKSDEKCRALEVRLQKLFCGEGVELDATIQEELLRLKKEIKNLEEELDDKEDELQSISKKLDAEKTERGDLQRDLDEKERAYKELSEQFFHADNELKTVKEEMLIKKDSLVFLSEILNAPLLEEQNRKMEELQSFFYGSFGDLIRTLKDYGFDDIMKEGERFLDNFSDWTAKKEKPWLDGKTTIAFLGEFSAGKTSIVNRLYSQDDPSIPLLPVSTKATTAIPTYIAGGENFTYSFISPDDQKKRLGRETFNKVSKDILDNVKGVSSLIKYFVMTCNNSNLKSFSILDTPGFSSNDEEDAERTSKVINESDALFWVFDVNAGTINRKSVEIIKKYLVKPLYVVINKVDTKADVEVQRVEDLIKQTLRDSGLAVVSFIRFSSVAPLENIMKEIRSIRPQHDDNYLHELDSYLNKVLCEVSSIRNQAREEVKSSTDTLRENRDFFDRNLNEVSERIMAIHEVIHFDQGFFYDDYRISEEEYSILSDHIDDITNYIEKGMKENIKIYGENVSIWQDQNRYFQIIDNLYRQVSDCLEKFNRVKNI